MEDAADYHSDSLSPRSNAAWSDPPSPMLSSNCDTFITSDRPKTSNSASFNDVLEVQPAHSDSPALSYTDGVDSDGSGDEEDNDGAYIKGKTRNLATFEVYDIFIKALNDRGKLNTLPPVKPAGGSMFIYDLGLDETLHNSKRKQLRCDQYRWSHKGTHPLKHQKVTIMKKSSMIDLKDVPSGDERFHRHEYWGVDTLFILHYVGDCSIFEGFAHRNSKYKKRPFIRSAPCVKEKILKEEPSMPVRQVYHKLVNNSTGGQHHSVDTPRNFDQVRNFRKELAREQRISHDFF